MIDFDDIEEAGGRTYAVTVYGATGFSGGLVVEHLDALFSDPSCMTRWCIAGRNEEKLNKIKRNCVSWPTVCAIPEMVEKTPEATGRPAGGVTSRGADTEALRELAAESTVIINCAGPYILCGDAIVAACVEKGCHYIDITGELVFNHRMIESYHKEAKEKGVMVIHMAGHMCAPSDIVMYSLVRKLGPLRSYREYHLPCGGMRGGGSFHSGATQFSRMHCSEISIHHDPYSLGGKRNRAPKPEELDPDEPKRDEAYAEIWTHGCFVGHPGMRIMRRTCGLFEDHPSDDVQYGDDVVIVSRGATFDESGAKMQNKINKPVNDIPTLIKNARAMEDAEKRGAAPGDIGCGPPYAARCLSTGERLVAVAEGENGEKAHAVFLGSDGYENTAMIAVAGALTLAEEADAIKPQERGGVLTPAFAFHGSNFIDRLMGKPWANAKGKVCELHVRDGPLQAPDFYGILKAAEEAAGAFGMMLASSQVPPQGPPEVLTGACVKRREQLEREEKEGADGK